MADSGLIAIADAIEKLAKAVQAIADKTPYPVQFVSYGGAGGYNAPYSGERYVVTPGAGMPTPVPFTTCGGITNGGEGTGG